MDKVFSEILVDIKPSKTEVDGCKAKFREIAEYIKKKFGIEALLMGSVAKNTFLKNDKDLDIFIFFPRKTPREKLEKDGLNIGIDVFNHYKSKHLVKYAEHPYTKGDIGKFNVEILPAYKLADTKQLISAVDRTPFHTEFILKNLKKNDDVILLKKFLKGIGCYGSNLKTEGFSGYLCELLILKFGSFKKLITEAQRFRYQTILTLGSPLSAVERKNILETHKGEALIFIDPVDAKRNVAAVLSKEKLARFIYFARKFERKPDKSYFYKTGRVVDRKKIMKDVLERGTKIIGVVFGRGEDIDDIFYPQLRRFERRIVKIVESEGFHVLESISFGDKDAGLVLELIDYDLPKYRKLCGPRIFDSIESQEDFIKKHNGVWIEDERFVSEVKRSNRCIKEFLCRVFGAKGDELEMLGIPKSIGEMIVRKYHIVEGSGISKIDSVEFWEKLAREKV